MQASEAMAKHVYEKPGDGREGAAGMGDELLRRLAGGKGGDDVIDAEFEVKK